MYDFVMDGLFVQPVLSFFLEIIPFAFGLRNLGSRGIWREKNPDESQ